MDKASIIKSLEILDTAYEAGVPRGDNVIAAEIMSFVMSTEEVDTNDALKFAYRLSEAIAAAKTSSLTVQLLEAQTNFSSQLSEFQSKLKAATNFIKAHGLLEEFTAAPGGKVRKSKTAEQPPPPVSESQSVSQETPPAPAEEPPAKEQSSTETQGEETDPAQNAIEPPVVPVVPEPAEPKPATPSTEPAESKGSSSDKPSAYNYLEQKGYTVANVDGIFTVHQTAINHAKQQPGLTVFPVQSELFRVLPDGNIAQVDLYEKKAYIMAPSLPETEYFTFDNRYVKNPGYVASSDAF